MNDYNWLIELEPEAFRERYNSLSEKELAAIDEVLEDLKTKTLRTVKTA